MRWLLDNRFAPVTWEIGFLETTAENAAHAFLEWESPVQAERGVRVERRQVEGCLSELLCALAPLTSVERRRFLFLPTKSGWTAFFDNGWQGTDVFPPMSYLAQHLRCRGLRAVAVPDEARFGPSRGAVIMEIYGPKETDFLNYERSLSVAIDNGWTFDEGGTPLPFEDTARYRSRRIRDRFTVEMLDTYLHELGGIQMFDETFYAPDGRGILIENRGPVAASLEEYPLDACESSGIS